jgi:hypothetical protein
MGKRRVGGAARFKHKVESPAEKRDGPLPPAHVQRKIARKVNFLDKVANSKAKVLAAKASIKKKVSKKNKPLPSLNNLAESLSDILKQPNPNAASQSLQQRRVVSAVGRLHTESREAARLKKVLKNDFYQSNPLAAITGHLNATLPPAPAPPKKQDQQKPKQRKKKKKGEVEGMQED